jgi:ubiquinone/menaquinone biosynthesis C-methylase UbiE
MLNVLKRLIPLPVVRKIRNYQAYRCKAHLFGDLAPLVPSVEQMFDGPKSLEEFKANGEEYLNIYKVICDLQPDEKMLDFGSGIGRKTLPLTQYLNDRAVYEGIDIAKEGIDWCRDKITPRFPNFHFQQIDVYNKHYNPRGKYQPAKYKFPFADESFSFVVLGSVFTHMLPDDVENYLSEIHRVLTKGGRCLITYFLLNEESLRFIATGDSTLEFKHVFDKYRSVSHEVPEKALALDENWIRDLYRKLGLKVMRLDYGSWCARKNYLSYQDLILAVKEQGE